MTFQDHFSSLAQDYFRFRPRYPRVLFRYLSEQAPETGVAWDCATGNGQAALGLAEFFDRVVATDASVAQLAQAQANVKVDYRVAAAEDSGLPAASVDLVTVAQALHWFDLEKFYAEVGRVLRPGACLAVWTYHLLRCTPGVDAVIEEFYGRRLGAYWTPERLLVEQRYQTIPFPFVEMTTPSFQMEAQWDLDELLGYLGTWSALKSYREALGEDPLPGLRRQLLTLWGKAEVKRKIHWPLYLRLGRRSISHP